jgi:hypothetical protein
MKTPEFLIGVFIFVIGLFVFEVNNAYRFGSYAVQAFFWIGISIVIYRIIKNKFRKKV